jgi:hypothetical protein
MSAARSLACLACILTAAGHAFAFLTVAINLADVTTDVVVAVQFFQDGDTVWAWLVVASLIIAQLVYTVAGAMFMRKTFKGSRWSSWPLQLRMLPLLPIAQLLPLFNFMVHRLGFDAKEPDIAMTIQSASNDEEAPLLGHNTIVQEQLDAVAHSELVSRRLQQAAEAHISTYWAFYLESAVEAAPQAVIQLLAITFLGRASTAQMVSLCCSLFSITSKAVVLSQAYDVRVMVFKFMLAAHDVFSAFYLFSTLLAIETVKQTTFFGLEVSWIGNIWLWKTVVCAALGALTMLAFLPVFLAKDGCKPVLVLLIIVAIIGFPPALLAYEVCKLTYVNLVWLLLFKVKKDARGSILASFLESDDSSHTKLRHVTEYLLADRMLIGHQQRGTPGVSETVREYLPQHRERMQQLLRAGPQTHSPLTSSWITQYLYPDDFYVPVMRALYGTESERAQLSLRYLAKHNVAEFHVPAVAQAEGVSMQFLYFVKSHLEGAGWAEAPFCLCLSALTCITVPGQLLSLAYLFINAAFQFHTHNILQATCFYAACFALLIAVLLSPRAVFFFRIDAAFHVFLKYGDTKNTATTELAQWIEQYYLPHHAELLTDSVPATVLPTDVVHDVVAGFLGTTDLNTQAMTKTEALALRERLASRGYVLRDGRGVSAVVIPAAECERIE